MTLEEWKSYIVETYSSEEEYLWKRYPSDCVFRHQNNRKWFALIADVPKSTFGMEVLSIRINDKSRDEMGNDGTNGETAGNLEFMRALKKSDS